MSKLAASGYFLVIVATTGFALKSILVKVAYGMGGDPMTVILMRNFVAAPLLVATLWFQEGKAGFRLTRNEAVSIGRITLFGIMVTMFFSYYCLEQLDASLGTLVMYTYPGFTVLMLAVLFGQKPNREKLVALGFTFVGLALIVKIFEVDFLAVNALGIAFGLLAAISFAYYNASSEGLLLTMSPIRLLAYSTVIINMVLLPFAFRSYPTSPSLWGVVGALGFFCGYIALLAFFYGVQKIGAARSVILSSLGPVFTLVIAYFFLGERLDAIQIVGMAAVLLGVLGLKVKFETPAWVLRRSMS